MGKYKQYLTEQRVIGKTSVNKDHYHEYQVDVYGNGKSMSTVNDKATAVEHEHKIFDWKVQNGDIDNHTHTIVKDKVTE